MQRVGSRALVMHGKAKQTTGGLTKKDLKYNKHGGIVSKKKSAIAKKEKRLEKAGYKTKKGVFGSKKVGGFTNIENKSLRNMKNDLKEAIQKANIPLSAELIGNRQYANPDNAVFIDKSNKIVYKIGKYKSIEVDTNLCIENECTAYDRLMENRSNDINKHFAKRFGCNKIGTTSYGLLKIQYIPDLVPISFNNNNTIKIREEAKKYLEELEICHNDEKQNLFLRDGTFFWIDFERATFDGNKGPRKTRRSIRNNGNGERRISRSLFYNDGNSKINNNNNNNGNGNSNNNNNNDNNGNGNGNSKRRISRSLFNNDGYSNNNNNNNNNGNGKSPSKRSRNNNNNNNYKKNKNPSPTKAPRPNNNSVI